MLKIIDLIEGCDIYYPEVVDQQHPASVNVVKKREIVVKTLTPKKIEVLSDSVKFVSGHSSIELPIVCGYIPGYHSTYHAAVAEVKQAQFQLTAQISQRKKCSPLRRLSDLTNHRG
jgi:hypothetical protein